MAGRLVASATVAAKVLKTLRRDVPEEFLHALDSEGFSSVIALCLGEPLPVRLMDAWEQVYHLRNKASHVQSLHMNEYAIIVRSALSPQVLRPLIRIKQHLSGRR